MAERRDPEFYVGYLDRAPRGIASRMRVTVGSLLALTGALAWMLVLCQGRFDASRFEYGVVREYRGVVVERPFPVLLLPRPGTIGPAREFSQVLLVSVGKHSAAEQVAGFDGTTVRIAGSLIYRDGQTILQVEPGSIAAPDVVDPGVARPTRLPETELGTRSLAGEIVDAKCWYGVMKPGRSKPHRDCAARCISGGIPPVLLVRGPDGQPVYYLLVSRTGAMLRDEILDVVAEPVEITGRLVRWGDLRVLYADRGDIRRR